MNINYKKIENVKHSEFDYEGQHWTLVDCSKNMGFSSKGLWNYMTNGTDKAMVYKADVVDKAGYKTAIALFN